LDKALRAAHVVLHVTQQHGQAVIAVDKERPEDERQLGRIQGQHRDDTYRNVVGPAPDFRYHPAGRLAAEALDVCPHWPVVHAFALLRDPEYVRREGRALEDRFPSEPVVCRALGLAYLAHRRFDDAERLLDRALDLEPEEATYRELGQLYVARRKRQQWKELLDDYLAKTEPLGLEHARVRCDIAEWFMDQSKFREAQPYADEAAETFAAWALHCAARCHEGLEDFERAESLQRAVAMRYGGMEWYLWCLRTGRGDAEAAKTSAQRHIASLTPRSPDGLLQVAAFHLCAGDLTKALEGFQRSFAADKDPYSGLVGAAIALELGQSEDAKTLLAAAIKDGGRVRVEGRRRFDLLALSQELLSLLDTPTWGQAEREKLDVILLNAPSPGQRCTLEFFVGRYLELKGQAEHAMPYYRRCFHAREPKYARIWAAQRLRAAKLNPYDPPPASPTPKNVAPETFELARWIRDLRGATLEIQPTGQHAREVTWEQLLPDVPFQIFGVSLMEESRLFDEDLRRLAGMSGCQRLRLNDLNVSDEGLAHVAGLTSLDLLHLRGLGMHDESLRHLARMTRLTQLALEDAPISGVGLKHLTALRSLRIRGPLTDEGLASCAKLPALAILNVDRTKITGETFGQLKGLPLRSLQLGDCEAFTDAGLAQVALLPSVESLQLSAPGLTDQGLVPLSAMSLRDLHLTAAQLTDAAVEPLSKVKVRQLVLRSTRVTSTGIEKLKAALPNTIVEWHPDRLAATHWLGRGASVWLDRLSANAPAVRSAEALPRHDVRLVKISAAGNAAITDDDVAQLRHLRDLAVIDLSGTSITDAAIDTLASVPSLIELVLRDTKVSEAAMGRLRAALPRCEISR
jgi:tetratricopeptide (TPR) repeat protein